MAGLGSLGALGIIGALVVILFYLVIIGLGILFNAFLYHIGTLFLKFKDASYTKALKTIFMSTIVMVGIAIVYYIVVYVLLLIPIIKFLGMIMNFLGGLLIPVLMYYLTYKFALRYYSITEKESLYAVLVYLLITMVLWVLLVIVMLVFMGAMFAGLAGALH